MCLPLWNPVVLAISDVSRRCVYAWWFHILTVYWTVLTTYTMYMIYVTTATHNPSNGSTGEAWCPGYIGPLQRYIFHSENRAENLSRFLFILNCLPQSALATVSSSAITKLLPLAYPISHWHTKSLLLSLFSWVVYLWIITVHFAHI